MTAWAASDLPLLAQLHELCLKNQVNYSVHYNEYDHTWEIRISSAAPSENYSTRSYSLLATALDSAIKGIEWIERGLK